MHSPNKSYGRIGQMLRIGGISQKLQNELMAICTYVNPAYTMAQRFSPYGYVARIPQTICLAGYNSVGEILIPRGTSLDGRLSDKLADEFNEIQWEDCRKAAPVEWPDLQIALNPQQKILIKAFNNALKKNYRPFGNYLFVAPTAVGKTLFQVALARETGQRTLVLCLTNLIQKAWEEDLKMCFDLSGNAVGVIRQQKMEVGDVITLASVQTLTKRTQFWPEINKLFGTVILDEAHRVTGPGVYRFISQSPAKYIIGSTATPRPKQKDFYVRAAFGPIVHQIGMKAGNTSTSMALTDVREVPTNFNYEHQAQNLDFNNLLDEMMVDEERNKLIVHKALTDYEDGNTVMIVTKRRAHLHLLKEMLAEEGVEAFEISGATNVNKGYTKELFKRIFAREVRMIVATNAAIELGANINPVNRLHLVMPVADSKSIEQLIGRIRRTYEGKKDTVFVYYLDNNVGYLKNVFHKWAVPVFRRMQIKRYMNDRAV